MYFESFLEDDPLPLQPSSGKPFDKASEISLGLDILSDAEFCRTVLKQRTHHLFDILFLLQGKGYGISLALLSFGHGAQMEKVIVDILEGKTRKKVGGDGIAFPTPEA